MKSHRPVAKLAHWASVVIALATFVVSIRSARADVRLEGDWDGDDKRVTLDADATSRAHAIDLLAEAAGWSVVVRTPLEDPVHLHVKNQSAKDVLTLLLSDHDYVARRTGTLVSIDLAQKGAAAAAPPAPPAPPSPPTPAPSGTGVVKKGDDRVVFGGKLTIEKDEVVHDVAVYGGRVDVYGTVTGDLAVLGGKAHVHDGAKVKGDATVIGGQMKVDDGADIEHDVSVVGGHLDRNASAKGAKAAEKLLDEHHEDQGFAARTWRALRHWGDDALSDLSASALLFVFGAVVVALATERSRALRVEIAARPMRTFALGVVGCIAAVGTFVALCITIIGIPVALFGLVVFVLAAYVGVSAALTTLGEALLRHRTESPYAHLALGCGLFFLVGLLPWVGGWATVILGLVGVGVMVATRAAGLIKGGPGTGGQTVMGYR